MKTLRLAAPASHEPKDRNLDELRNSVSILEELAGHLAERVEILETREQLSRMPRQTV